MAQIIICDRLFHIALLALCSHALCNRTTQRTYPNLQKLY